MRFIGDVHGKLNAYELIRSNSTESIQIGDIGAGFVPLLDPINNHRWIRGNHVSPAICKQRSDCIKDGTYENSILYIGGASQIIGFLDIGIKDLTL